MCYIMLFYTQVFSSTFIVTNKNLWSQHLKARWHKIINWVTNNQWEKNYAKFDVKSLDYPSKWSNIGLIKGFSFWMRFC